MKKKILICVFIIQIMLFFIIEPASLALVLVMDDFSEICVAGVPNIGARKTINEFGLNPYCLQQENKFGRNRVHEIFAYVKIEGKTAKLIDNSGQTIQYNNLNNPTLAYILQQGQIRDKKHDNTYSTQYCIWTWMKTWLDNVGKKLDNNLFNWKTTNSSDFAEESYMIISEAKKYAKQVKTVSLKGDTNITEKDGLIGPIKIRYTGNIASINCLDDKNNTINNGISFLSNNKKKIYLSQIKSNEQFYIKNSSGKNIKKIQVKLQSQKIIDVDMWFFRTTDVKSQILLYAIPKAKNYAPSLTISVKSSKATPTSTQKNKPSVTPKTPKPSSTPKFSPTPSFNNIPDPVITPTATPTPYYTIEIPPTPIIIDDDNETEIPNQELQLEKIISNVKLINTQNNIVFSGNPEKDKLEGITDLDLTKNGGSKYLKAELKENEIYGSTLELTYRIIVKNPSYVGYYSESDTNKEITVKVNEITEYLDPTLVIKETRRCRFKPIQNDKGKNEFLLYDIENPILYTSDESIERKDDEPTSLYVEVVAEKILSDKDDDMYIVSQAILKSAEIYQNPKNNNITNEEKNILQKVKVELPKEPQEAVSIITPPTGENKMINEKCIFALTSILMLLGIWLIKKK